MDYEKKYNEALERFKSFKEKYYTKDTDLGDVIFDKTGEMQKDFNGIFSELHESEDERMMTWLITQLKTNYKGNYWANKAIEYLEKQKEQKPTPNWMPKFLDELRSKKNYFDWDEHRDIESHILAIINWIAPDYFKSKEEQKLETFNEPYNPDEYEVVIEGNATSLKRKDQKSIEDVIKNITKNKESAIKFLKSAGIMDDNGELAEMYRSEQKPIFRVGDNIIAKDGTCIPKEPFHIERIEDDCYWNGNDSILICNQDNFQLISQKPAEWSEGDKLCVSVLESFVASFIDSIPNLEQSYRSNVKKGLQLIQSIRLQPKPKWSEEDKTRLTNILIMLQEYVIHHYSKDDVNKSVDWLKALPERFNLQPKPEWSKEDEKTVDAAIYWLKKVLSLKEVDDILTDDCPISIRKTVDRLKSLHLQSKQKLSKKDKKILLSLHHVMNCADAQNAVKRDGLSVEDVCNFLFSIEPYWKPSEEQVEAVRYFVNKHQSEAWAATGQWKEFTALRGLLGILQKLM